MIDIPDRPTRRLYFLLLLGFATFGTVFTIIGAALPHVIRTFGWSYALTGTVLAANAVGYFVSTFACGILVQRLSPKTVIVSGLALGAVSLSLFIRWPSPWLNLVLNFCVGLCQGAIEVVTNLELIHMERKGQSRLMNLAHAGFCVGAIVGPAVMGLLLAAGKKELSVFAATAFVVALMGVLFAISPFPKIRQHEAHEGRPGLKLLLQPFLLLVMVFLLLYVGVELGVSSWVSEYFVRALGAPQSLGALSVSIFWLGMLAGRFSLSVAYRGSRQEYLVLGLTFLAAAALGLTLLVTSTWSVAVAVFLTGLGFSGTYPLTLAMVGRYHRSGMAVGAVTTGGGVGSFTFPFLMAIIAQTVGIRGGFLFYVGVAVVLACLAAVILRMTSRGPVPEKTARRTA